jgi:hypothetical protein
MFIEFWKEIGMKQFFMVAVSLGLLLASAPSFADKSTVEFERRAKARQNLPYNRSNEIDSQQHLTQGSYVPKDLMGQGGGTGFHCNTDGYQDPNGSENCVDLKRRSDGSMWRIRYAYKYHNTPVEYVFKLTNGQPTLWVKYNPGNQRVEYASAGAQQYAASHGGGQYAKGNQPAQGQQQQAANGGQCDHLSGKMRAGCEAAALVPGLGDFFKR